MICFEVSRLGSLIGFETRFKISVGVLTILKGQLKKTLTVNKFWVIYKLFIWCFCNGYQKSINYRTLLIFVSKKGNQLFATVASINSENTKHGFRG